MPNTASSPGAVFSFVFAAVSTFLHFRRQSGFRRMNQSANRVLLLHVATGQYANQLRPLSRFSKQDFRQGHKREDALVVIMVIRAIIPRSKARMALMIDPA